MNRPRPYAGVRNPPKRRNWAEKLRPVIPWLLVPLAIVATVATGLPRDGWRTPHEAWLSIDPRSLIPLPRFGLEAPATAATRWLLTAAFAAPVGAIVLAWRGGARGTGCFAAGMAFDLFLLIELLRLFKPGQMPDFRDPMIAAIIAPAVWWLLRLLPYQPVTRLPRHGRWRTRWRVLSGFVLAGCGIGLAVGGTCAVTTVADLDLTPARIAALVARLPEGRSGTPKVVTRVIASAFEIVGIGSWLRAANRLDPPAELTLPTWSGANISLDGVLPAGRLVSVDTSETLRQAIDSAMPGDVILLQPDIYRITQSYITITRPGSAAMPITVRAARLGSVTLESDLPEALKVAAPYWHFENLVMKGVCKDDGACDNGFHIVGAAEHTLIHNLRIQDFNAQIKINGENGRFPDAGRIERTTLIDTHARRTGSSVTPIDLVGANGWTISENLIADFVKDGGNDVSYGAFAKGASRGTIFTRNVVFCAWSLRNTNSATIGLSFGGGGTMQPLARDQGRSGYEHADGVISDNLIAFCSDDGIYLNRAANSVVQHNTLVATAGIEVRYPETTADVDANLVDGPIRARDDGLFWEDGNESGSLAGMFLGRNPVRGFFEDPARLDLRWRRLPALVATEPGVDLCGAAWTALSPAGAFRDFRACGAAETP
jgi:hypothetical protein